MKAVGGFASVATKLILPPEVEHLPAPAPVEETDEQLASRDRRERLLALIEHRQPEPSERLTFVEPSFADATRELGFHSDIDYLPANAPLERHRALWERHLPTAIAAMREQSRSVHDEVVRLAFEEGLRYGGGRGKISRLSPRQIVDRFLEQIGAADAEDA